MEASQSKASAGLRRIGVISPELATRHIVRWGVGSYAAAGMLQWFLDMCIQTAVDREYINESCIIGSLIKSNNVEFFHRISKKAQEKIRMTTSLMPPPPEWKNGLCCDEELCIYKIAYVEITGEMLRVPGLHWGEAIGGMPSTRVEFLPDRGIHRDRKNPEITWHQWDPFDLPMVDVGLIPRTCHERIRMSQEKRKILKPLIY
jgi:hypothetical protein